MSPRRKHLIQGVTVFLMSLGLLWGIRQWSVMRPNRRPPPTTLRVAFPYDKPAAFYDPLRIFLSPEYTFLENTFSPLVEYTPKGELVSAVAERFEWRGTEARFQIRRGLKTVDGHRIDAKDVETSLKRMMIVSGNTHGDLRDMLCPAAHLSELDDPCPGMEVQDGGLTLSMRFEKRKIFLFPMLAALDFAVIPRGSIDSKTLAIKDYRNTSGPYYVKKDNPQGRISLAANPHHFHYSEDMPQEIVLVPTMAKDAGESLRRLASGDIDAITTIDRTPHSAMMDYAAAHADVSLHSTLPLRTYVMVFTQKGRQRFSEHSRSSLWKGMRDAFKTMFLSRPGYAVSEQLFSVFGEGALSPAQLSAIRDRFSADGHAMGKSPEMLAWVIRMSDFDSEHPELKRLFPNTRFLHMDKVPGFVDFKKTRVAEPDFVISGPDMGFLEDIGLITHYLSADFFYVPKERGAGWMRDYMAVPEKKNRLSILRELHFNTIYHAVCMPLAISPYTALFKKPWVPDLSKVQASDALWRLRRN